MKFFYIFLIFLFFTEASFCQVQKIDDLKKNLPQITDSIKYADALNRIGQLFFEKNVDSSFSYAIKARELSKKLSYQKGIADATNTMGVLYDMKGDLQLSLKYYNDAYNTYKTLNEPIGVVQTTMRIALVYNENAEHKKATAAFQRALEIGKTLQKDSIVALVLANYLLLYPDKIAADTIPLYLNKARQIAAKYHDRRILIITNQIEAQQIIRKGDTKVGVELLKKASADATEMDLNYLNLDILISLGDIYIKTDFPKGMDYYRRGLLISEEKGYRIYTKMQSSIAIN
jgi:tetratricopeptide (TPR) repeat protein